LVLALGLPATIGTLLVLVVASVFALSNLSVAQLRAGAADLAHWLRGTSPGPEGVRAEGSHFVNPPLPLGRPEPFWRRWWRRLVGPKPAPPSHLQAPQFGPARPPAGTLPAGAAGQTMATPTSPAAAAIPSAASRDTPRIIGGGGQVWRLPVLADILEESSEQDIQGEDIRRRAQIIERTLESFGVPVQVVEANQGPAVTQFGLRPGIIVRKDRKGEEKRIKVRVSQIQVLANDLSLALAASPIRIEAPVPGRDVVGVEVPNVQISLVALRGVMESEECRATEGPLVIGLGRDVSGQAVVADLARMPHLLVAGATGSGKSVCVNALITALLLTHTPETLRLLMIDPKRVELTIYNGIPHLIAPVVVDIERAVSVLQWATREMERRYKLFAKASARNIESYNEKLTEQADSRAGGGEPQAVTSQILPYIVILIDELADLMLSAPDDVERYVCRIAQMARATGIHLVIATQRPSVDVVTGLIKANFPARISFAVTSQVDSRVILDTPGAEQLLGRGDMLFMAPDTSKLQRLQGCFVSERETQRLVRYWQAARTFGPQSLPWRPVQGDSLRPAEAWTTPGEAESPKRQPSAGATFGVEAAASPGAGLAAEPGKPQQGLSWRPVQDDGLRPSAYRQQSDSLRPPPPAAEMLEPPWLPGQESLPKAVTSQQPLWSEVAAAEAAARERDDMYDQAVAEVRKAGRASVSLLQRRLRIGYSRAARLIEEMEAKGVVGPDQGGSRGREVRAEGQSGQ
jgi:S-DNA-T family DNA segregation ATPase FtsK/SpoIIIE